MTPDQFVAICKGLYGADWQRSLMRDLEISPATIWRYASGKYPIPKKVELAIQRLQERQAKKKAPR